MRRGRRAGRPCRRSAFPARTAMWAPRRGRNAATQPLPAQRCRDPEAILEVSRSEAPADRPRRPAACYSRRHLQPYRQWLKAPSSGQACLAVAVNGLKTNPHGADSAQTHCFLNVPITLRSRCIWRRRCIAKRIGRRRRIAKTRWEAKKHRDDASQGEDTLRRRIGNAHGFRIRIAKRRSSQVLKRDKAAIPVFRARMRTDTHGSRKSFDRV